MCGFDEFGRYTECENPSLHNPWNGFRGVATVESRQNVEAGTRAAFEADYPQSGPLTHPWQPTGRDLSDPLDPKEAHSWPLHVAGQLTNIERALGVLMTHQEGHWQHKENVFSVPAGATVGTDLTPVGSAATQAELGFKAKTILVENPTPCTLWIPSALRLIPPQTYGFPVPLFPSLEILRVQIWAGTSATAQSVMVVATERPFDVIPASGASPPTGTITNVFNVQTYGALGNGVANDTASIQAAITAAQALGNGALVFFPPGVYLVDKAGSLTGTDAISTGATSNDYCLLIQNTGGITLLGYGATIKLRDGAVLANTKVITALTIGGNGPGGSFSDVTVKGLTFDGGAQTRPLGTLPGIIGGCIFACGATPSFGAGLKRIRVEECRITGWMTSDDQGAIEFHDQVQDSYVLNNVIENASGAGIFMDGGSSCEISGNHIYYPAQNGISAQANSDNDTAPPSVTSVQALRNNIRDNWILYPAETFTITIGGGATGGTFTLTFGAQTTSAIPWNTDYLTLQAELEALSSIGAGNVKVRGSAGGPWTIVPWGTLAGTSMHGMTGSGAGLTPSGTVTIGAATGHSGIGFAANYTIVEGNKIWLPSNASGGYGILLNVYKAGTPAGAKSYPCSYCWVANNYVNGGFALLQMAGNTDNNSNPVYCERNVVNGNIHEGSAQLSINLTVNSRNNLVTGNNFNSSATGIVQQDSTSTGNLIAQNNVPAGARYIGTQGTSGAFGETAYTVQDNATAGSGTLAKAYAHDFPTPTYRASNTSVTTTDAINVHFAAPAAGTNETLTNAWAAWFDGHIKLADVNIGLGTATGTKIGTSSSQKLGIWGATPIVQPSAVGSATGYAAGTTGATFHSDDTYTGNVGATAYTLNGIVAALKNLGLIAS